MTNENDKPSEPRQSADRQVEIAVNSFAKGTRRRQLRASKEGERRNLGPKPPRNRDWEPEIEPWDELDPERDERIMPIDEKDRRRTLDHAVFESGTSQPGTRENRDSGAQGPPGTVVSVSSGQCMVERDGGRLLCRVKSSLTAKETLFTNVVAVGDRVTVRDHGGGRGIVEEVLPRHSALMRPDVVHGHRQQVIVVNADQLLIVASWRDPFFWPELIDRCIIAGQLNELPPVVCVNKTDLAEDAAELKEAIEPYEALGHRVMRTSVVTNEGVPELRELLHEKTTALTGLSGAGKSSLISAVQPGLRLRTSEVMSSGRRRGEGQHTTTQVTMLGLDAGGFVVDTPGVREFGLSGLRRHELVGFFPEISSLAPRCRFSNCAHIKEPGCAVRDESGGFSMNLNRYRSYRSILKTLPQ